MSDPSKDSRIERRKKKGREAVNLPDAEAIRKLFPKKAVEQVHDASQKKGNDEPPGHT